MILGSLHEVAYSLMTCGIPPDAMPVLRENGEMDLSRLHGWIERRRESEKTCKRRRIENSNAGGSSFSSPTLISLTTA
jgi:hypothetical protein